MKQSSKFAQSFALTEKVEIVIPTTIGDRYIADNSLYVEQVMRTLAENFGGASSFEQQGAWVSEGTNGKQGELIVERSTVVYAFTDELTVERLNLVYDLAQETATVMLQECVAVTINGVMHFVDGVQSEVAV